MPPKGGKKGPRAYKLPDTIPAGEVLTDLYKKQWKLGHPIGQGGFGMIYLASENKPGNVGPDSQYVVKIEPHENGPLFVELHFYQRAAKAEKVDTWKKQKKLPHLGVPKFIGAGNHEHGKCRYRFMVMQRFGEDLWKKFSASQNRFSVKIAFTLGIQIIDALEYLHSQEYVHADIKSSNLLLGHGGAKSQHQVYLVDFGLANRYMPDGKHKEYKEDPRKAHDGTAEFTSRDAHKGVEDARKAHDGTAEFTSRDAHKGVAPSRRGDLEILGYNLVEWLTGSLPWYDKITDCKYVMQQKIKYMDNISSFLTKCFPNKDFPSELKQYLEYVQKLGYSDKPDYNKVRTLFKKAIVNAGYKDDGKLEFAKSPKKSKKTELKSPARVKSPARASTSRGKSPARAASKAAKKAPVRKRKATSDESDEPHTPPKKVPARKRKVTSDESDEPRMPKTKGRPKKLMASPPKTPQQRKMLEIINAKNSTESPVPKRKLLAKTPPSTTSKAKNGTPASAKKIIRRKRAKTDSSTSSTQTTPGLERNVKKAK